MAELVPIPSPGVPLYFGDAGDPVVVVVPDEYGRLPWLVEFAQALTHRDFHVAVLDLYGGFCTTDDDTAEELAGGLDIGDALAEIDDAIATAQDTGTERVAVLGFSLGGWLALLHAQAGGSDAVVSYYASLAAADHGVIPAPVLLHWAEQDVWEAGEDPAEFVARLEEHGTPVTQHRYAGTRHLFANATVPVATDTRSAALAYARTVLFLEKHLAAN